MCVCVNVCWRRAYEFHEEWEKLNCLFEIKVAHNIDEWKLKTRSCCNLPSRESSSFWLRSVLHYKRVQFPFQIIFHVFLLSFVKWFIFVFILRSSNVCWFFFFLLIRRVFVSATSFIYSIGFFFLPFSFRGKVSINTALFVFELCSNDWINGKNIDDNSLLYLSVALSEPMTRRC